MTHNHYRPNPNVLAQLKAVDFVAVIGPTAAGKTTLINAVMAGDRRVHQVTVTTSRAPRPGEQNDKDYHFRDETVMREQMVQGEFVQVAPSMLGALYATLPQDYATDGMAIMAVIVGAMPDFLRLPFKRLRQIFVLPPDWETWQKRIQAHGFTDEQLVMRLAEARMSLAYAVSCPDVLFVRNADLAAAVQECKRILTGQEPVLQLEEGQKAAKELLVKL